jgi:hypothetical protein
MVVGWGRAAAGSRQQGTAHGVAMSELLKGQAARPSQHSSCTTNQPIHTNLHHEDEPACSRAQQMVEWLSATHAHTACRNHGGLPCQGLGGTRRNTDTDTNATHSQSMVRLPLGRWRFTLQMKFAKLPPRMVTLLMATAIAVGQPGRWWRRYRVGTGSE